MIGPCVGTPVTPGIVQFDPTVFVQLYPAFASVPASALEFNFQLATDQLNNSCCSVVKDAPTRQRLLGLLTAHITALLNGVNGQAPNGAVGRISDASEGSVSASLAYSSIVSESEAFYIQTTWGAMYWQATSVYRTARYVPPCRDWDFGYEGFPQ